MADLDSIGDLESIISGRDSVVSGIALNPDLGPGNVDAALEGSIADLEDILAGGPEIRCRCDAEPELGLVQPSSGCRA